jgi:hypothetical protein
LYERVWREGRDGGNIVIKKKEKEKKEFSYNNQMNIK